MYEENYKTLVEEIIEMKTKKLNTKMETIPLYMSKRTTLLTM